MSEKCEFERNINKINIMIRTLYNTTGLEYFDFDVR